MTVCPPRRVCARPAPRRRRGTPAGGLGRRPRSRGGLGEGSQVSAGATTWPWSMATPGKEPRTCQTMGHCKQIISLQNIDKRLQICGIHWNMISNISNTRHSAVSAALTLAPAGPEQVSTLGWKLRASWPRLWLTRPRPPLATLSRDGNKDPRRFHKHGKGPHLGLLLVESAN